MVNPKEYMLTQGITRCRWQVSGCGIFVAGNLQTVMAHWTESGNSAAANRPMASRWASICFSESTDTGDLWIGNMTEWPSWIPTAGKDPARRAGMYLYPEGWPCT
jgi:hypothetical protein